MKYKIDFTGGYLPGEKEPPFIEIKPDNFLQQPFDIEAPSGYEPPVNKKTKEKLPFCCVNHTQQFIQLQDWLKKLPNCCDHHRKLAKNKFFNKRDYENIPLKIIVQHSYTLDKIIKVINNEDWYEDITDYIEYNALSFGIPAVGLGEYLSRIKFDMKKRDFLNQTDIPFKKAKTIYEFIENTYYGKETNTSTDLNILWGVYNEWLKNFPFELSFFAGLKSEFENRFPFIKSIKRENRYSKLTKASMHTKESLIEFLMQVSKDILKKVNSFTEYKKWTIREATAVQFELALKERELQLTYGYENSSIDKDTRFRKILKDWLADELSFISKITPYIKHHVPDIVGDIIDGMKQLQQNDTNAECIRIVRGDKSNKETSFRYWFKDFFAARYKDANVTAEEEKGTGRIDLKISFEYFQNAIIEFKGWWNKDKCFSAEQICSYLTDFESEGYIFMINNLKQKAIDEDYVKLILENKTSFLCGSYKIHRVENSDICFYETKHQLGGKEKTIFHFIFNVHF